MIFIVKTLNEIDMLSELTTSAAEHNIDIVCIQEHKNYHVELEIEYHDTGNGWMFISESAWKSSVSAIIGGIGMLLCPRALKLLDNIEKNKTEKNVYFI